jgi:glycosyltransferase involved in cell wall biosynthesis
MSKILYIVIPCYNEEAVLPETAKRLKAKMAALERAKKIDARSRVVFLDDGSKDKTWELIEKFHKSDKVFGGIKMSRNRGHQNVLLGGLMSVKDKADVVISMDADLQDDINAVDAMLAENAKGADVVYGVRRERKTDSFFKRTTALMFYRIMRALGVDSVYNHADYRLMSRRALDALADFKEVNLFLRGMVPLVGFKSAVVYYDRAERFAGESHYPLRKMINFAIDGITSFSVKPLRIIAICGFLISFVSLIVMIYALIQFIVGHTVSGWAFTAISIWFIGGVQILFLGIVGEYIGKIYNEAKARPRFIVEKTL